MGTNGLRGWRTSETPVAKKGFPASSSGRGGWIPSATSFSPPPGALPSPCAPPAIADGYCAPLTFEKLQPPFSKSWPRSSLISPPPPPGRSQVVRRNLPPSSSSRRAQILSRRSRKRSSTSLRSALTPSPRGGTSSPTRCRRVRRDGPVPRFQEQLLARRRAGHPLLLADGGAHFRGEVLLLLLQPLAERHAHEAAHVDVLADHRDGVGDLLLDGALALGILDE